MALICDNCHKGVAHGHSVSHAKNRVGRLFKPNLQKLKVMRNGITVRVKFCTDCIQRLKKDKHIGNFKLISYIKEDKEIKETLAKMPKMEIPVEKTRKTTKQEEKMKIEDLIGKK